MNAYRIDPELAPAAAALPVVDRTDVAQARRISAGKVPARPATEQGVTVEHHNADGADGRAVRLRVYRADHRTADGAIYHVHGGGFILGDLESSHRRNVEIAREAGAVLVSVDYRLAPEWSYPTPLEDVYSGLLWLHENAAVLDVDSSRLVLHGLSAGGALAAAATLMARDRDGPPVGFLFLASPALDDRLMTPSSRAFVDTPALTRRDMEICWAAYLGPLERGAEDLPRYAAPGRWSDPAWLPPTYLSIAEFDPLRDEAIEFARALLAAGAGVEMHLFPGGYHGSLAVRGAAASERQLAEEIAVLARAVRSSEGTRSDA